MGWVKIVWKISQFKILTKNWIIYGNILFNIMLFCILFLQWTELVFICCYALFEYLNTLISNLIYDRLKWGISQIYWFAINFPNSKGLDPSPKVLIEKPTVNTIIFKCDFDFRRPDKLSILKAYMLYSFSLRCNILIMGIQKKFKQQSFWKFHQLLLHTNPWPTNLFCTTSWSKMSQIRM